MLMKSGNQLRPDISPFLIHFTKEYNRRSPFENLVSILQQQVVIGTGPQCFFSAKMRDEQIDKSIQDQFKVSCFSEVPLEVSHHLINNPTHGDRQFRNYGIVFNKETVKTRNGNPVLYVNHDNHELKQFFHELYKEYIQINRMLRYFVILVLSVMLLNKELIIYSSENGEW
jgi:hypothetical protein